MSIAINIEHRIELAILYIYKIWKDEDSTKSNGYVPFNNLTRIMSSEFAFNSTYLLRAMAEVGIIQFEIPDRRVTNIKWLLGIHHGIGEINTHTNYPSRIRLIMQNMRKSFRTKTERVEHLTQPVTTVSVAREEAVQEVSPILGKRELISIANKERYAKRLTEFYNTLAPWSNMEIMNKAAVFLGVSNKTVERYIAALILDGRLIQHTRGLWRKTDEAHNLLPPEPNIKSLKPVPTVYGEGLDEAMKFTERKSKTSNTLNIKDAEEMKNTTIQVPAGMEPITLNLKIGSRKITLIIE